MIIVYAVIQSNIMDRQRSEWIKQQRGDLDIREVVLYADHLEDVSDQLTDCMAVITEQGKEITILKESLAIAESYRVRERLENIKFRQALLEICNFPYSDDNIFDAEQIIQKISCEALKEVQP